MMSKRRVLIGLLVAAMAIRWFSEYPLLVERYYSTGMYPYISAFQRILFGWIPISIGDLFYAFAVLWIARGLWFLIGRLRRREATGSYLLSRLLKVANVVLAVYVSFNILWGLNYNRPGIDHQLQLETLNYSDSDLVAVTAILARNMNELQPASLRNRDRIQSKRYLFRGAVHAYHDLARADPRIVYSFPSVKPSIYSYLGNYLGFTGYYNPFSGEAQVNTTAPVVIQPFTTCHEIGHQLGYAKESEANFAGFLSASVSEDDAFRYSVYFDMYSYAAKYLYFVDSAALKTINESLSPAVRQDMKDVRTFFRKYSSPVSDAIDQLYGEYLRANQQPSGKMSYNEVVAMLIAYYRKQRMI